MNFTYIISILSYTCIMLIGVLGVVLLTGMTGIFSFGQAAFMALGAYTSAIMTTTYDIPFAISLIAAVLMGIISGLIIALPTIKLRSDYISLVTFGFTATVTAVLNSFVKLTGGGMGFPGIPKYSSFILIIISTIIFIILVFNFKYSRFGRSCYAVRTDQLAAESVGINSTKVKLIVFIFSALITSYAGAIYAHYLRFIDPSMFQWIRAAEWIIIVFVGGTSSITGAIFSTFLLSFLPEILRFSNEWRIVIYSLIVLSIVNFRPTGLFGEYEIFKKKYKLPLTKKVD